MPLHADGSLAAPIVDLCRNTGLWLKANGEAIYGSRPFERDCEGETFFTRRAGFVYVTTFAWPVDEKLSLASLKKGGATLGRVTAVELFGQGSVSPVKFIQDDKALTIECPQKPQEIGGVEAFVYKVIQDKVWINDDDPGVKYLGWAHECNLDKGEFNNDLHTSEIFGAVCQYRFTGSEIELIGTKAAGLGGIEVFIDDKNPQTVSLAAPSPQVQTVLFKKAGLSKGTHVIEIVNKGDASVNVDGFIVPEQTVSDIAETLKLRDVGFEAMSLDDAVRADGPGRLLLKAKRAELHGSISGLVRNQDGSIGGSWDDGAAWVSWTAYFPGPGAYLLSASLGDPTGGMEFDVSVGKDTVVGKAAKSGSWSDYQCTPVGMVTVAKAGPQVIVMRPHNAKTWKPVNINSLIFTRAE